MKGTTVSTSKIFLYSIWSGFADILTSKVLVDGYRELGRRSMGFLKVPDLL